MTAPIESLETTERAAEQADTQQTARRLAKVIAQGVSEGEAREGVVESATELEATATEEPKESAEPAEPAAEPGEEPQETRPEIVDLLRVEEALGELGIELGTSATEIAPELLPAYERALTRVVDLAQNVLSREMEASEAIARAQQMADRIQRSPDKLLLALALGHPQRFQEAMETFQRMESDPEFKKLVVREIEAEVKANDAERRERSLSEYERRWKARQVALQTRRMAAKYGVPVDLAEEMVAMAVEQNNRDLDLDRVEPIVQKIARRLQGRQRPARAVGAAKAAAAKSAPGPIGGSGVAPPPASGGLSPTAVKGPHMPGSLRNAVREAAHRVASAFSKER